MKKRSVVTILILVIGFSFYKTCQFVNRIDHSDPEYNTIYSDNYKEKLFNNSLLGMSQKQVIKLLGEPFSKTQLEFFNAILYTNHKDSVDFNGNSNSLQLLAYSENLTYRFISFDSSGNVKSTMIKGYAETEDEIKKMSKPKIISVFGKPEKEIICNCNCTVYSYSQIKKGNYSGKHPIINQRNIVFDNKQVAIKIIKKVGNTYSKYDEICVEK